MKKNRDAWEIRVLDGTFGRTIGSTYTSKEEALGSLRVWATNDLCPYTMLTDGKSISDLIADPETPVHVTLSIGPNENVVVCINRTTINNGTSIPTGLLDIIGGK